MGPREGSRGRCDCPGLTSLPDGLLQWGRVKDHAEGQMNKSMRRAICLLQWGRVKDHAEGR